MLGVFHLVCDHMSHQNGFRNKNTHTHKHTCAHVRMCAYMHRVACALSYSVLQSRKACSCLTSGIAARHAVPTTTLTCAKDLEIKG